MKYLIVPIIFLTCFKMTYAESKEESINLREEISCFPISGISDFARKFENIKSSRTDSVDMFFEAHLKIKDGGLLPERVYIKNQENEYDLSFSQNGKVVNIEKITKAENGSELCAYDPLRAGTPEGEDALEFDMDADVIFIKNNGYHHVSSLKDGLKDSRFFYKKMVPAPTSLFLPKFTHLLISAVNDKDSIYFEAKNKDNDKLPIESENYCANEVIKFKDLENADVESLYIKGGSYLLYPIPDLEKLTSIMGGEC